MYQNGSSRIVSVGYYLPSDRVHPEEMVSEIDATRFGVDNTIVEDEIGVKEVRHSHSERPSDMAVAAAEKALQESGVARELVDLVIFCGIEGDHAEPATAHYVQHRLGLSGECYDVSNACLGFMTGLSVANAMIGSGAARYVLVCTGERPSLVSKAVVEELRKSDDADLFKRRVGMLSVGDVGGAAVIGPPVDERGFVSFVGASEGQHADLCYYSMNNGRVDGQMVMGQISARMIRMHRSVYPRTLTRLGWDKTEIDGMITHQVGQRPFAKLRDIFGMTDNKMTRTYDNYGNITSGTFVLNLGKAIESGQLSQGDKVYAAMAGSGLSVVQAGFVL